MLNVKAKTALLSLALAGAIALPAFAADAPKVPVVDSKPPVISTYSPELSDESILTRADLVMMLHEKAEKPVVNFAMNYTDVAQDAKYAEAVRWASSEGFVSGYTNGEFGPEDTVTREQLAVILYRHAQSLGQGFTGTWAFPLAYTDAASVHEYAYEAVCWMTVSKVMGDAGDNTFAPQGQVTFAEAKEIMALYDKAISKDAEKDPDKDTDKPQIPNPFVDCSTMEDAAKITGYAVTLPEKLPEGVSTTIRAAKDMMVEVILKDGDNTLIVRKGLGKEDISGDYTEYAEVKTVELDGHSVTTKGTDGKIMVATWQDGEYTYAIRTEKGLDSDQLSSLVSDVK